MIKPKNDDYDLWKDDHGRFFIRIKHNGEECEVEEGVFKLLNNMATKERRERQGVPEYGVKNGKNVLIRRQNMLSLDLMATKNMLNNWCSDGGENANEMLMDMVLDDLKSVLTDKQLDVFVNCILGGVSMTDYAKAMDTSPANVHYHIVAIRKKAEKILK